MSAVDVISQFERDAFVVGKKIEALVGGKRTFTSPAPLAVRLAVFTDQAALASLIPGGAVAGQAVAYLRLSEANAAACVPGASVYWTAGERWEIKSADPYEESHFADLGDFKVLILKRIEV